MIKNPTVFVLGAGASTPFGYPSGKELKEIVCQNLSFQKKKQFIELQECGFYTKEIENFREELFYSGIYSVDAFLADKPDNFIKIGKIAIAQALIPCENKETLFDLEKDDVNWYKYLYNVLRKDVRVSDFVKNDVSFITFNYDRSLEEFLFTALSHTYGKSEGPYAEIVNNIPIVHVYGILNYLPWQNKNGGREYSPAINPIFKIDILNNTAEKITIISEKAENAQILPEFYIANNLLLKAKCTFFLGFGYNQTNLDRLNIPSAQKTGLNPIYGTAIGLGRADKIRVVEYFKNKMSPITLGSENTDAMWLLRDHITAERGIH